MNHGILIFKDRQHDPSYTNRNITFQLLFIEDKSPQVYDSIRAQFQEHYDIIAGRPTIQNEDVIRISQNVGNLVRRANGTDEPVDTKQFEEALELIT